jgi:(E)-4-hydroxy-3-methylbut-2-enyl-diphosphate synthase
MVYSAGKTDHTIRTEEMVDHIVGLVEARAEALRAAKTAEQPVRAAE